MPTEVSQSVIEELAELIDKACMNGDNVSAIAERAGNVTRPTVSRLRHKNYGCSPSLETTQAILRAIGYEIQFKKVRPA